MKMQNPIIHGFHDPVTEVVLHCAALSARQVDDFANMSGLQVKKEITRWHIQRGFRTIGYHALFMPDGEFVACRPYSQMGAHVKGRNVGRLGFLLIEKRPVDRIADFQTYFTDAQGAALRHELALLWHFHGVRRVSGHNDYANKLCPGFRVQSQDWLPLH